jgi:type I restriction enzyme, S subunit
MGEWQETTLGEVLNLNYGKSLPERERISGNVPVYSSSGLSGWHNRPLTDEIGLIIGRKGTIGSIHFAKEPFFTIDTAYYATQKDCKLPLTYTFYLLKTLGLDALNEDSAVPGLNRNTAYAQEIRIPIEETEQRAIAEVLSSLDDKIDLLHRQNQTLEALAETLFRQWFIEEADPAWETATVGSVAKTNLRTVKADYPYTKIQYLDTGSITKGKIESLQHYELKDAPSRAKRLIEHNDIIISTVRPNHKHYGF